MLNITEVKPTFPAYNVYMGLEKGIIPYLPLLMLVVMCYLER